MDIGWATGEALLARFKQAFARRPQLFRAPGRINIIGEHTDYNDGFVLPAALDLAVWTAIAPRPDRRLHVRSSRMDAIVEVDLDAPEASPRGDWSDYVCGVALMSERSGRRLTGADLMIDGDLPMGAGLSASAALEVSVGYALMAVSGLEIDRVELAKICQRAENEFVGARCGVMDQYASCCGEEGHALLLDCRKLEARLIAIDPAVRLMVCDSMVRHRIAGSEYNRRREECEQAVALLSNRLAGVAVRDITSEQLDCNAALLPDIVLRRARHVVGENSRTLSAAAALENGDFAECGRLMDLSHASLRDDYEVSCRELDLLVEIARDIPGVYGVRMMGGGFGGCAIGLVDAGAADRFAATVRKTYGEAIGSTPTVFSCFPGPGAGPVDL